MRFQTLVAVLACSALANSSIMSVPAEAQPWGSTSRSGPATSQVCGPVPAGSARCFALRLDDPASWRGRHSPDVDGSSLAPAAGYGPADLRSAYGLPSSTQGRGQLVAVVDAYDDPNAESDLAVYRSAFGLPPCTTTNGCFREVDENGGSDLPHANWTWALEIAIDLDMVSAICPNCRVLLVETTTTKLTDLGTGVNTAARLGADAISNSYGAFETKDDPGYDALYYQHPGIAVTVASGDNGYGVYYPASSPFVTAVGGTTLLAASNSRGWSETAWSGSGGGCSSVEPKPSWQTDNGCANRTVADVAAVADPTTGVAVYDTYKEYGWLVMGGTSVSAPILASVYALAGNESQLTYASLTYSNASDLYDIVSGSTGNCGTYLCNAGPGYDGPTGNGTADGTKAF